MDLQSRKHHFMESLCEDRLSPFIASPSWRSRKRSVKGTAAQSRHHRLTFTFHGRSRGKLSKCNQITVRASIRLFVPRAPPLLTDGTLVLQDGELLFVCAAFLGWCWVTAEVYYKQHSQPLPLTPCPDAPRYQCLMCHAVTSFTLSEQPDGSLAPQEVRWRKDLQFFCFWQTVARRGRLNPPACGW